MRCQLAHVIGVDGCRDGWCAVSIHDERHSHRISCPTIYQLFQQVIASSADLICVDIPIGLLDCPGQRPCDVEARKLLGKRAPAVFTPPCRSTLSETSFQTANATNRRVSGKGLAIQAYSIMQKIAEVDSLITPALQSRVYEVHPELCFWALNDGRPMSRRKSGLAGRAERWRVLRKVLPSAPEQPPLPRDLPTGSAIDDYIDTLVAAWTAACIARGSASRIPSEPTLDNRGLRMEMWLPAA